MDRDIKRVLLKDIVVIAAGIVPVIILSMIFHGYKSHRTIFDSNLTMFIVYLVMTAVLLAGNYFARYRTYVDGADPGVDKKFVGVIVVLIVLVTLLQHNLKEAILVYIVLSISNLVLRFIGHGKNKYLNDQD